MNRERADVKHALQMPARFPISSRIVALPDAAARGAGPDRVRLRRIANETGDSSADVRRPDAFPLRRSGRRREFVLHSRPLRNEFADARLAERPRSPRLEPDAPPFMVPRNMPELSAKLTLPRPRRDRCICGSRGFLPPRFRRCLPGSLSHGDTLQFWFGGRTPRPGSTAKRPAAAHAI